MITFFLLLSHISLVPVAIFLYMPILMTIVIYNILVFWLWLTSTFISIILIFELSSPLIFNNQNIRVWGWELESSFYLLFKISILAHSIVTTPVRVELVKKIKKKSFPRVWQNIKKPKSLNFFIKFYSHSGQLHKTLVKIIYIIKIEFSSFYLIFMNCLGRNYLLLAVIWA